MVIARFYKVKWPIPNHLIPEIQVLNFAPWKADGMMNANEMTNVE